MIVSLYRDADVSHWSDDLQLDLEVKDLWFDLTWAVMKKMTRLCLFDAFSSVLF